MKKNCYSFLPVILSRLERVLWTVAAVDGDVAVAVVVVVAVVSVVCFLTVPMAVFEIYCLAVPASLSNSFEAVPPLFSKRQTKS